MNIGVCTKAGSVPNPIGVMFTAPSGIVIKVSTIIITNKSATSLTFNIYYRHGSGGTPVRIFPKDMPLPIGGAAQESDTLFLFPQDTIEGDRTGACDYLISAIVLG